MSTLGLELEFLALEVRPLPQSYSDRIIANEWLPYTYGR